MLRAGNWAAYKVPRNIILRASYCELKDDVPLSDDRKVRIASSREKGQDDPIKDEIYPELEQMDKNEHVSLLAPIVF